MHLVRCLGFFQQCFFKNPTWLQNLLLIPFLGLIKGIHNSHVWDAIHHYINNLSSYLQWMSINTHSILHVWTWLTSLACPTSNSFGKKLIENFANICHICNNKFYNHYRFRWSLSHPHWPLINIDLRHSQSKKCKLVFANEPRRHAKHWNLKNLGSTLLRTTNDIQHFFSFLMMFPFGFQYLVIIYINFKFNLNCIKHYIHGG